MASGPRGPRRRACAPDESEPADRLAPQIRPRPRHPRSGQADRPRAQRESERCPDGRPRRRPARAAARPWRTHRRNVLIQRAARRVIAYQHVMNTYAANVPGPPVQLYFAGAPVLEVFPVVPIMGNVSIGVGALSYAGSSTSPRWPTGTSARTWASLSKVCVVRWTHSRTRSVFAHREGDERACGRLAGRLG